jgi:hypothetical protein
MCHRKKEKGLKNVHVFAFVEVKNKSLSKMWSSLQLIMITSKTIL